MKWALFLVLILSPSLFGVSQPNPTPVVPHQDPSNEREFQNVYQAIRSVPNGTYSSSSMTIQGIQVDSITVNYLATITLSTTTVKGNIIFSPSTYGITGTKTNDSANTGDVGEYVTQYSGLVNAPASGQWGDMTSISLTPGDWDVSLIVGLFVNGATFTRQLVGVGTTAGNNGPNITGQYPDDIAEGVPSDQSGTGNNSETIMIPAVRVSLTTAIPVYAKMELTGYSGGPAQFRGRISARRMR